MKVLLGIVPVAALIAMIKLGGSSAERLLVIDGGRTTFSLFPTILEADGIKATYRTTAEGDSTTAEESEGFKILSSDLKFRLNDGRLSQFDGGTISHSGSFVLRTNKGSIDGTGFTILQNSSNPEELQLFVQAKDGNYPLFTLTHPRSMYQPKLHQVTIGSMDATLTIEGAQHLGKPELAGTLLGSVSVFGASRTTDGRGEIIEVQGRTTGEGGTGGDAINVSLSAMSSLTSAGRTGTFPNGMNGLTMSTTSCNVGTANIPWAAPMQTQHPAIAMNLYRLLNGKFEQVGWSWMKHGFFATNSSGCGSCQNPGTGALLGPGCSDTYATSNNSDRNYLGGRDEFNAFTGVWTCQNSYFSNYQNDCVRRNNGSGLDATAHRLEVLDSDMGNSGATYYYEAYYVNANDTDHYNNIGSRTASMTWNGSNWSISDTSSMVQGPAINRWGELRNFAEPRTEGDIIVAVQTTDLGNGMWHYEYAVYNHDCDRQVRQFSIPIPDGFNVQNIGFRDIDRDATNQWTSSYSNNAITWSTGVFGSSNANPLKFASVFNFRFDANVAPTAGNAAMEYFKSGSNPSLTAATKVPLALNAPTGYSLVNAVQFAGSLASLTSSDNDRLEVGPSDAGARAPSGISVTYHASVSSPSAITLQVESLNTLPAVQNPQQTIYLYNVQTDSFDLVDTRGATNADSVATVNVTSNVGRYIDASGNVTARVLQSSSLGEMSSRWRMKVNRVGFSVR